MMQIKLGAIFLAEALVFTTVVIKVDFAEPTCKREPNDCCLSWSSDKEMCDECETGYFGNKCEMPCRFPNFGKFCQFKCNCTLTECNHISGCQHGLGTFRPYLTSPKTVSEIQITTTQPLDDLGTNKPCLTPPNTVSEIQITSTHTLVSGAFCDTGKDPKTQTMLYITVTVGVWAIIQTGIYLYLSFLSSSRTQVISTEANESLL